MDNIFGVRLKALRMEKGYTQRTLAEKLGISPSAVGMYEQGRREPDNKTIIKLCRIFDVSGDYLIGTSDSDGQQNSVEVSEVFDEFTRKLSEQEGLMFDGILLNNEDRRKIIDAIKVVAAIARQQHKTALGNE